MKPHILKSKRAVLSLVAAACLLTAASSAQAGLFARHAYGPVCGPACAPAPVCEPVTVILTACHPCTGCHLEIPVCVPCCCEGLPEVCYRPTLFGAGKAVYTWCCGHRVVVRFQKCGTYRVIQ